MTTVKLLKAPVWTEGKLDRKKLGDLTGTSGFQLDMLCLVKDLPQVLDLVWTLYGRDDTRVRLWLRTTVAMGLNPLEVMGLNQTPLLISILKHRVESKIGYTAS